MEKPSVSYGYAEKAKKGEDFYLVKTDCQRVPGNSASTFSVFAIFDGHHGNAAAIYARDNLLNHVLAAMPRELGRDEWLHALPRALGGQCLL
ncbi:probable protein phosphatase 2C 15 [Chenopodium quinoa]|nr:probable protein phosphatase 2C 15 [Chenopodium quinoa]